MVGVMKETMSLDLLGEGAMAALEAASWYLDDVGVSLAPVKWDGRSGLMATITGNPRNLAYALKTFLRRLGKGLVGFTAQVIVGRGYLQVQAEGEDVEVAYVPEGQGKPITARMKAKDLLEELSSREVWSLHGLVGAVLPQQRGNMLEENPTFRKEVERRVAEALENTTPLTLEEIRKTILEE